MGAFSDSFSKFLWRIRTLIGTECRWINHFIKAQPIDLMTNSFFKQLIVEKSHRVAPFLHKSIFCFFYGIFHWRERLYDEKWDDRLRRMPLKSRGSQSFLLHLLHFVSRIASTTDRKKYRPLAVYLKKYWLVKKKNVESWKNVD